MTHDEMIEVIRAHKEGKTIECNSLANDLNDGWMDEPYPLWAFQLLRYRIKPEPPKPREFWIEAQNSYYCGSSHCRQASILHHSKDRPEPLYAGQLSELIHVREVL